MFEIANKLQWDVAEHDADRAMHHEGFVASSAGGDLASLSNGFTLSNWNSWMSQQVTVLRPDTIFANQISPYLPVASAQSLPLPAEILVLDPDPRSVVLGVMS